MSLPSAKQRARLYDQLRVYVDSGTSIQEALGSLSQQGSAGTRELCERARQGIMAGQTFANALAIGTPALPKFEQAVLHASELSGRLPIGCTILRDTLRKFAELRQAAIMACLYPAFVIHMAVFVTGLMPAIVQAIRDESAIDWGAYFRHAFMTLLILHAIFWGSILVVRLLKRQVGSATFIERCIRVIPVVGKTWWSLVVSRFAQAYDGMLNAGANVIDALEVASLASNSAILRRQIQLILPHVKQGEQIGPWLEANHVLGKPWEEFWTTGEKSGRQEEMLNQIVRESAEQAEQGFTLLKMVVPKAIYITALLYVGYQIIAAYGAYLKVCMDIMNAPN